MKISYENEPSDDKWNTYMYENDYSEHTKEIQLRWSKLRALKLEYLKLYSELANIIPPENEFGYDCKEEWGLCLNSQILWSVPANLFNCSVGMVRKMRNKVPIKYDIGTCKSCPYFIPSNSIKSRSNNQIAKSFTTHTITFTKN